MSDFTLIFTDLPLGSLELDCLEYYSKSTWSVGFNLIDKYGNWPVNERLYPDLFMYSSGYPLNTDMLELASEYLGRGHQIIFVLVQIDNYPPKEDMQEWTINISEMEFEDEMVLKGKIFEPELFNIYKFVKI